MHFTTEKVGDTEKQYPRGYSLNVKVVLGLPVELKVVFYSASRTYTTYEIFDQHGESMGRRDFWYAVTMNPPNTKLVDDLNVLLEEFGIQVAYDDFAPISQQAAKECDARCGSGLGDGDVIITLH